MSESERPARRRPSRTDDGADQVQQVESTDESTEESTDLDDVDALLDEIDAVLEENAEDFVRNYVQKGGQ